VTTVEERIAVLEGRVMEQSNTFDSIRDVNAGLVREMALLNARMDRLDQRIVWMMGMQMTTLLAMLASFVAR
jgi:uncharacterized coiled-coil protein SlyX